MLLMRMTRRKLHTVPRPPIIVHTQARYVSLWIDVCVFAFQGVRCVGC